MSLSNLMKDNLEPRLSNWMKNLKTSLDGLIDKGSIELDLNFSKKYNRKRAQKADFYIKNARIHYS